MPPPAGQTPESQYQYFTRRLASHEKERASFISHWDEIAQYLYPRGARFLPSQRNRGEKLNQKILRNVAGLALRTAAAGMMGGMTSPSRPWYRLTLSDPDLAEFKTVKRWLHIVQTRTAEVFSKSNLYNVLPTVYRGELAFGQGPIAVLEDPEDVIRCYSFPIGSYCLAQSQRLAVDTLYRIYSMTVRQIVMEFGYDECSTSVRNQWDRSNYENWIEVIHVIEPNFHRDARLFDSRNKPFRSVYFERANSEERVLRESGFDELPFMAPRWDVTGEDIYGWSPGMDALADIKELQLKQRRKAQAIDILVKPPMVGPTTLKNQRSSILPGDVTYVDSFNGQASFKPAYEINPRIDHLIQDMGSTEEIIRRCFYEDLFLMLASMDAKNVTAEAVAKKYEEKMVMLGPVVERNGDELLDPLIDRTFAIMLRRGMIPPPPPEIEGMSMKVDYISVLAQAQKMVGTSATERLFSFAGNLSGVNPEVLDNLNFDEGVQDYADMLGSNPRVIRSGEEVLQLRKSRAQQQQAAQMAAMAKPAADGAAAAKILSETDIDRASALARMMGTA